MLMSVIEGALSVPAYPELAGKRVLITGLTSRCGVDIASGFAEHKGRLVLQFAETSDGHGDGGRDRRAGRPGGQGVWTDRDGNG